METIFVIHALYSPGLKKIMYCLCDRARELKYWNPTTNEYQGDALKCWVDDFTFLIKEFNQQNNNLLENKYILVKIKLNN